MQSKNSFLSFACLALAIFGVLVLTEAKKGGKGGGGGGGGGWGGMNKTCKGEAMTMANKTDVWKKCAKEMKGAAKVDGTTPATEAAEAEEGGDDAPKKGKGGKGGKGGRGGMKNKMCMRVCTWKAEKVLGEDGKYNSAGMEAMIKAGFPSSVHAELKKAADECAATHGSSFSMNNNCEGYQKFAGCQMMKTAEVCGWGKGKKGGGKKGGKGKATTEATE